MTINGIVCKSADEQRTAIKTLLIVASIYWQVVAKWQDETKQARL